MTEFNSGRGGRDDDIVDLEAQPVNATDASSARLVYACGGKTGIWPWALY